MGFLDYMAMSSQGQIGEMITVGTLIGKVGVWIGMVSIVELLIQTMSNLATLLDEPNQWYTSTKINNSTSL
jgi:uncharacterized membrane protein YkgB